MQKQRQRQKITSKQSIFIATECIYRNFIFPKWFPDTIEALVCGAPIVFHIFRLAALAQCGYSSSALRSAFQALQASAALARALLTFSPPFICWSDISSRLKSVRGFQYFNSYCPYSSYSAIWLGIEMYDQKRMLYSACRLGVPFVVGGPTSVRSLLHTMPSSIIVILCVYCISKCYRQDMHNIMLIIGLTLCKYDKNQTKRTQQKNQKNNWRQIYFKCIYLFYWWLFRNGSDKYIGLLWSASELRTDVEKTFTWHHFQQRIQWSYVNRKFCKYAKKLQVLILGQTNVSLNVYKYQIQMDIRKMFVILTHYQFRKPILKRRYKVSLFF